MSKLQAVLILVTFIMLVMVTVYGVLSGFLLHLVLFQYYVG